MSDYDEDYNDDCIDEDMSNNEYFVGKNNGSEQSEQYIESDLESEQYPSEEYANMIQYGIPEFFDCIFEPEWRYNEALELAEIVKSYFKDQWWKIVMGESCKFHNRQDMHQIAQFLTEYEIQDTRRSKPLKIILEYTSRIYELENGKNQKTQSLKIQQQ
ncbi:Hypothetical_protein [Hexamita inflata]|uniref:Hypothetical_protein n=1 Tax=Hexamita inflata TaxID=28002 RepID=A0ABP1HPE2_9EUKA